MVACASNLQPVIPSLYLKFQELYPDSDSLHFVYGSSGKLYAQITHQAPYSLFLSADTLRCERLVKQGLAKRWNPFTRGRLAYCVTPEWLDKGKDKRRKMVIAIPNPKLAPYGEEAVKVLNDWDSTELASMEIVYAQNIQQVNQMVKSGAADMGFTSMSSSTHFASGLLYPAFANRDGRENSILLQGYILLDSTDFVSKKFADFLLTEDAQTIFENNGYLRVNEQN